MTKKKHNLPELAAIQKAESDIRANRVISNVEMKRRILKWLGR